MSDGAFLSKQYGVSSVRNASDGTEGMTGAALTDNFKGALLMMASMAAFTLNDTFVKALAGELPLFQLLFLRGLLTTFLVGLLAWRLGAFSRRIPRRVGAAPRSRPAFSTTWTRI